MNLGFLIGMAMHTLAEPRKIAREIFTILDLSQARLWELLILNSSLSTAVLSLMYLSNPEMSGELPMVLGQPTLMTMNVPLPLN